MNLVLKIICTLCIVLSPAHPINGMQSLAKLWQTKNQELYWPTSFVLSQFLPKELCALVEQYRELEPYNLPWTYTEGDILAIAFDGNTNDLIAIANHREKGTCILRLDYVKQTIKDTTNTTRYWAHKVALSCQGDRCAIESLGSNAYEVSLDHNIYVWDCKKLQQLAMLKNYDLYSKSIAINPASKHIAVAERRNVKILNYEEKKWLTSTFSMDHDVKHVALNPDGNYIAITTDDVDGGITHIGDCKTGTCEDLALSDPGGIRSSTFSHDGKFLALIHNDHSIGLRYFNTRQHLRLLKGHTNKVNQVIFNHDDSLLASQSDDETVRIWDRETGNALQKIDVNGVPISIAFNGYSDLAVGYRTSNIHQSAIQYHAKVRLAQQQESENNQGKLKAGK